MSGALDSTMKTVAGTLINVFGTTATMRRRSLGGGGYDPIAGTEDTPTETDYTIEISPPSPYTIKEIDGSAIKEGDLRVIASKRSLPVVGLVTLVPDKETDRLILSGDFAGEYRVVKCMPLASGNEAAAYELQLRK